MSNKKIPQIYEDAIEIYIDKFNLYTNEETPIDKLFKLLSEVQGVEIKPYDKFDIKDVDGYNLICGPYYLYEHFKRWSSSSNPKYNNGEECNNERVLRGILTGEMKILKCKKAVVLTEDDIICLRYYLKNGYRYIANNRYIDFKETKELRGFKNNPQKNKYLDNRWSFVRYDEEIKHYEKHLNIEDELSFIHYDYPEIWDIEELLEQERVSND